MSDIPLRIAEIFESLQGESIWAGFPFVFIRLAGCSLDCAWCDTPHGKAPGEALALDEVVARARSLPWRRVLVTGGEPLEQAGCVPLLERLIEAGRLTSLETNGAESIERVPYETHIVLDIKPPSARARRPFHIPNVDRLKPSDEIKIVIDDLDDFHFALKIDRAHDLANRFLLSVSPTPRCLASHDLKALILGSGRDIRLNVQLHKGFFKDPEPA